MAKNIFVNLFLTGMFCSMTSSVCAGDASSDKKTPLIRRSEQSERVRNSSQRKMSGEWGARNPSSFGCPPNDGFLVTLDYLIMRSKNPNLSYAYDTNNVLTEGSVFVSSREGKLINPNRTWRPGFKIGLGWHSSFDDWDTCVNWMYYYNKSVTNYAAPDPAGGFDNNIVTGLFPFWGLCTQFDGDVDTIGTYWNLNGVWNLNYNMLDWDLGRSMYLTKAFALRPIFGLRTGWIHQRFAVEYNRSFSGLAGNRPLNLLVRENNNFWGFGIRSGVDTEWELGAGFSFLGKLAASLLSGRTNTRREQLASPAPLGAEPIYEKTNEDSNRVQQIAPNLELNLGLGWGTCLSNDTMYLGFDVSWQSIYWWGQFSFIRPSKSRINGDGEILRQSIAYPEADKALIIEGVAIRGRLDF